MCLTVQMALALRLGGVGTSISKDSDDDGGRISCRTNGATEGVCEVVKVTRLIGKCDDMALTVSTFHQTK